MCFDYGMEREWVHTFKQDHARDDTSAETEPTVHEPVVRSDLQKDNLHRFFVLRVIIYLLTIKSARHLSYYERKGRTISQAVPQTKKEVLTLTFSTILFSLDELIVFMFSANGRRKVQNQSVGKTKR